MTERQIASNEARLAQLAEREGRAYRCGFIGEDAILEDCAAKIGMRKATSDEAAAKEVRAVASSILPIDLRKIGILNRRAALKRGMKFFGRQFFHLISSNIGVTFECALGSLLFIRRRAESFHRMVRVAGFRGPSPGRHCN
jgi:hypothetical protein